MRDFIIPCRTNSYAPPGSACKTSCRVRRRLRANERGRALAGIAIGVLGAYGIPRALTRFLFGVTPADPVTFGAVVLLLIGVCGIAGGMSTRSLAWMDPVDVMRGE